MRIGELARAAGCQPVTVRFYERKGLLGAAIRSDGNYRVYGKQDLERLLFIRNSRGLGLTLKEIERLVSIYDDPGRACNDVNTCLDQHLEEVEKQNDVIKATKKRASAATKLLLSAWHVFGMWRFDCSSASASR